MKVMGSHGRSPKRRFDASICKEYDHIRQKCPQHIMKKDIDGSSDAAVVSIILMTTMMEMF